MLRQRHFLCSFENNFVSFSSTSRTQIFMLKNNFYHRFLLPCFHYHQKSHVFLSLCFWWNLCVCNFYILRKKKSIGSPCFDGQINTLRARWNGRNAFSWIKIWILIKISLKFAPKGTIYNKSALVQIMAWCRVGDRPLSEPIMVLITDT